MKNIQSFENFDKEQTNENLGIPGSKKLIGGVIKSLITLPLSLLVFGITQLINPRTLNKELSENYLDIYNNLDVIKDGVEKMIEKGDLTDTELRKAKRTLKQIDRVLEKYPTLEEYKNKLKKVIPMWNIKNQDFLKRKIDEYEPTENIDIKKVEKILKKINKQESTRVAYSATSGKNTKSGFQERLEKIAKDIRGKRSFKPEDYNESKNVKTFEAFMGGTDDIPESPKPAQIEITGEKVGYITNLSDLDGKILRDQSMEIDMYIDRDYVEFIDINGNDGQGKVKDSFSGLPQPGEMIDLDGETIDPDELDNGDVVTPKVLYFSDDKTYLEVIRNGYVEYTFSLRDAEDVSDFFND